MGNQNKQNRRIIDDETSRMNREYDALTGFARGPNNDFGEGRETSSRARAEQGFSGGASYSPGGGGYASAAGGPNVNFTAAGLGDYGSARSGYEEFAANGGVDAASIRNRTSAMIPAFYDSYKDNAKRRANTQGGYSPGFDAQMAEIGRQAGREGFNASRQVEGDIAEMVQAGRLQGLGGLTNLGNTETNLNMYNQGQNQNVDTFNSSQTQQNNQFNAGMQDRGMDRAQNDRQFGASFGEGQRQFNANGWAGLNNQDYDRTGRNMGYYSQGIGNRAGYARSDQQNRQAVSGSTLGGIAKGIGGIVSAGIGIGNPFKKKAAPVQYSGYTQ